MKSRRQPDLFASRKPRAVRRKGEADRLLTKRELRASLALYSPTGRADLPDSTSMALEQREPEAAK